MKNFFSSRHLIILVAVLALSFSARAQVLVSAESLGTLTAAQLSIVPGLPAPDYGIEYFKITYNTTDAVGDPTIATGLFSIPDEPDCVGFPFLVYMHGTTLNKENVPSRDNQEAAIGKYISGQGYYSCAPDYIGMGDSPGLHPYVHAESEATAGVDMVRACRELVLDLGQVDNGQLFITGYSQGGHAAMAMHKYIEDNGLLEEMDITASGPASGPYNLSGSQAEVILSDEPYTNPGYLVYTLASYDLAYDNLYDTYSDILQSPYDETVVPFFDGNNTTLSMGQLNGQLPNVVSELIQPAVLEALATDPQHPIRVDLEDNDNYDWAPTRPITMYYCTADEQVTFSNSLDALAAMEANGSTVVSALDMGEYDHGGCYLPSMFSALVSFEQLKETCVVGLDEMSLVLELGPNPFDELLVLKAAEPLAQLFVTDIKGAVVYQTKLNGLAESVVTLDWPSGTYVLSVRAKSGAIAQEILIKE